MTRWMLGLCMALGVTTLLGVAEAQYRPSPAREEPARPSQGDRFERAVDLTRFRTGNYEWDTQEFVKSGLTALHEDHVQLTKELAALRAEVAQLAAEVRRLTEGRRP